MTEKESRRSETSTHADDDERDSYNRQGCLPVSPHDEFAPTEFAPTSTELDRVRPQPGRVRPQPDRVRPQRDRVRPQTDCVPFHVSEVLNREFF